MATWHALAKLRIHTQTTIAELEAVTTILGIQLRHFKYQVCKEYTTYETPKEMEARKRREARNELKQQSEEVDGATESTKQSQLVKRQTGKVEKGFSISTFKTHALGHYPAHIRLFGTTDSTSTQRVSVYLPL
jgi:hypothetical protein